MIRYGFFNSESGDRVYNADDFSNLFNGVVGDGIFRKIGQAFETSISSNGKIIVGSGRAVIKGRWIESTASESLEPLQPEENTVRIDSVILRCDMASRSMEITIRKGSATSAPTLGDTALFKEIRVANITMAAGSIKPASIEDARDESWVHPLVGVHVTEIKREITTSAAITSTSLGSGIDNFDPEKDSLNIYINGMMLKESEYTVSGSGRSAKVDFKFTLQADNRVTFVVLKSVAE